MHITKALLWLENVYNRLYFYLCILCIIDIVCCTKKKEKKEEKHRLRLRIDTKYKQDYVLIYKRCLCLPVGLPDHIFSKHKIFHMLSEQEAIVVGL